MNKTKFKILFQPYAKTVDKANEGFFWILNNEIITEIITSHIPTNCNQNKTILDAGGGTGRWVCNLAKIYKTKFVIYDLSDDMLKVAKKNLKKANIENRVQIIKGNLENMIPIKNNSIDYIISMALD